MVEVTNRLVSRLSVVQRRKIVEHVHGPVPVIRSKSQKVKDFLVVDALRRLGLVQAIPPGSSRPTHSELTLAGREAAAKILAECADMLVAAGALDESVFAERPLAVLARLRAEKAAAGPEAPETAPESPAPGARGALFPLE